MIPADLAASNRAAYDFSEPEDVRVLAAGDPLLVELVATRAFQRLKSIRFLGGIDYLLVRAPNGAKGNIRYTRFQHSLGVARLALNYCDARDLRPSERRIVYVSALLHDIGHAPLSHSLEPVFKEAFGLEHHQATEDVIFGRAALGKEIYETLKRHAVDVERVCAVISGAEKGHDGFFSGPINFDTIEGILRSWNYGKSPANPPHPTAVAESALWRATEYDRHSVDEFWRYKDLAYRHVINSRAGALADFACQLFMRRHLSQLTAQDYFTTELELFKKLPGLRSLLTSPSFGATMARLFECPVAYTVRRFSIDQNVDFYARNDKGRYLHTKEICALYPQNMENAEISHLERGLFDESD